MPFYVPGCSVSGLKSEDVPELRMEAEERHGEVYHQKLVPTPSYANLNTKLTNSPQKKQNVVELS